MRGLTAPSRGRSLAFLFTLPARGRRKAPNPFQSVGNVGPHGAFARQVPRVPFYPPGPRAPRFTLPQVWNLREGSFPKGLRFLARYHPRAPSSDLFEAQHLFDGLDIEDVLHLVDARFERL